ncbi:MULTISPECIES: carbohydrate ABC transporter permease [Rhizobium/Agrobacterium group]|jgi:oligogalacturonide transport system permease protein|uniref:Sugar ABC transporter permease n=2 Tax=Rhizobium/Agrobacterium group TaxID=227290 RepID=A0A1B9TM10_AGRTU|nr:MULTISPECIES: sugar ABC transporter permease [Rhizobium/Agrobacterium group]AHK02968.1 putative ABC sugar transporter [Agrobacterium tumefaciens LBA4213 (Ach5)]AKC08761.1 oligogalacturonide transport system permease protein [Agrobacterium tumefaciens]EHJ96303.1 sugar ABC transporter permease [Agrobacterium tumefaciens 5A]MDP9561848.1 oligogalacturonide transport system permease protein [Rhizobium nepotum]HCV70369.1 sugar ABC transporter permease [Agrobacterium sp.]
MKSNRFLGLGYLTPYIIGLLVFTAIPFLGSLYLSFTRYDLMSDPTWAGLANYERLFTRDRTFMKSLNVTLFYVFLTVPLKLAFALFIAAILNYKLQFINFFRTAFYVPSILGGSIAIAVLWRYIFASEGLANMALAAIGLSPVDWFGDPANALFTITLLRCWQFGSAMVIFLAALQSIDKSLYEAAAIDGAGKVKTFFFITLPLLTPVIFFNLIMQMVQAFQEFNGPYIITQGGPLKSTYLLPLYIYDEAFKKFNMGYASAIAWVLFTIITVLTLVAFWSSKKWVYYAGDKRN